MPDLEDGGLEDLAQRPAQAVERKTGEARDLRVEGRAAPQDAEDQLAREIAVRTRQSREAELETQRLAWIGKELGEDRDGAASRRTTGAPGRLMGQSAAPALPRAARGGNPRRRRPFGPRWSGTARS
jgi:hypothetical protein